LTVILTITGLGTVLRLLNNRRWVHFEPICRQHRSQPCVLLAKARTLCHNDLEPLFEFIHGGPSTVLRAVGR
jgi:hypothetical protein